MFWRMTNARQAVSNDIRVEWNTPIGCATTHGSITRRGYFSRIACAWQASMNSLAPMGYEDETGFHYGERSEPTGT
jgi:hypothetical protein